MTSTLPDAPTIAVTTGPPADTGDVEVMFTVASTSAGELGRTSWKVPSFSRVDGQAGVAVAQHAHGCPLVASTVELGEPLRPQEGDLGRR